MTFGLEDRRTIFALSSGQGKAGIAVFRISGPGTAAMLEALIGKVPLARRATLRDIRRPPTLEIIDTAIVLWFPAPSSFTGEDSAELHVHGSRAVKAAINNCLAEFPDFRPAMAGEFARRALENGKLDLVSVEALGDLTEAETEQQRRLALLQAQGGLTQTVEAWRRDLVDALVLIESDLDFSDEADAPHGRQTDTAALCHAILRSIGPLIAAEQAVERVRDGLTVLIAGPPNAGKSTLLNALAKRDVAIVSEIPGTTRDLIEVKLDLGGFPINLVDTAGIRDSVDPIEILGIARARKKAETADLILWLTPAAAGDDPSPASFGDRPLWRVRTKIDGAADQPLEDGALAISALTGQNFEHLLGALQDFARAAMSVDGSVVVANQRQRSALQAARSALTAALEQGKPLEIVAEDLRQACYFLECLIGKVGVEDVLDRLFSKFCVGK